MNTNIDINTNIILIVNIPRKSATMCRVMSMSQSGGFWGVRVLERKAAQAWPGLLMSSKPQARNLLRVGRE